MSSKLSPNASTLTSQISAALAEAIVHGEHLDQKAQLAIDFLSQAIERLHALVLELTDKEETTLLNDVYSVHCGERLEP